MAKILGLKIRNFRALREVEIGQASYQSNNTPLTPMTAVIGRNGVGKSTLFDAFGFLSDCLKLGVEESCDANGRGGFAKLRSKGQSGPIEFTVYYRQDGNARPITYELVIDEDKFGRPYVLKERLRQRRKGQRRGQPFPFLVLENGKGRAWKGEEEVSITIDDADFVLSSEESRETEIVNLQDNQRLGIATLGALKQHPRISAFRNFIEGWYLSYFTPDAARDLPLAGPQKHLNIHGDNLGNVVQFMKRAHPKRFQNILVKIADRIPGIDKISTEISPDGRALLMFNDKGFHDPFYAQQMSDGTLKVFAYLLLLEDPNPPPLLCIEEPENGLYHKLLEILAGEFREHATGRKGDSQVFVTTHQPYFVDALTPAEVWMLEKGEDGFAKIRRTSDDDIINNLVSEELPLGGLWFSDYLERKQTNAS